MHTDEQAGQRSWSIHEALAIAYQEFSNRFGADLLWAAFDLLTRDRERTLAEHAELETELDQYLGHAMHQAGSKGDIWISKARTDEGQTALLLQAAVRWWCARDDLLSRPAQSRVPCEYAEGNTDHVNLQLLAQMLYRGRAPYTTCD